MMRREVTTGQHPASSVPNGSGDAVMIASRAVMPVVSVIVPTFQEEQHLRRCVESLVATSYPPDRFELLIVDGGSTDGTVGIAKELARQIVNLRVLHNPKRRQAAALNLGIEQSCADASIIIRADAHAAYPYDFIGRCVVALERSGADIVVFAAVAAADGGCLQAAVAAAQNTLLGVGDSWYRVGRRSRYVDHGFHGCFRRSILTKSGLYDESFSHNEDAELSFRVLRAGGRIYLERSLEVAYYSRATLGTLAVQYYRYGRGRAQNILKHGSRPALRQLLPMLLIIGEIGALAMLAVGVGPKVVAAVGSLLSLYVATLTAAGLYFAASRRRLCLLYMPAVLATMHHAWGVGALSHLVSGRRGGNTGAKWGKAGGISADVPTDSGVRRSEGFVSARATTLTQAPPRRPL